MHRLLRPDLIDEWTKATLQSGPEQHWRMTEISGGRKGDYRVRVVDDVAAPISTLWA